MRIFCFLLIIILIYMCMKKTLLVNGGSYGECWTPTQNFIEDLGCDNAVNVSKYATSFQRTCRSTIEWIAQNGNPEFVVVPVTFAHRWELAISDNEDQIDGSWFPLQRKELLDAYSDQLHRDVDINKLKLMIDLYYGSIPTIKTYWDKLFSEVIMLSAFLESKKIRHLIFDMCNQFDKKHIKGYKGFDKLDLIKSNKNVIDLFKFSGNRHMWQSMEQNKNVNVNTHHAPEQYKHLENYLLTFINQ